MRIGAPRAVGELLVTAVPELRDRLLEAEVRCAWASLVGPELARRSRPDRLASGCLTILVDNSPWLQELTLRSRELIDRIGERFPEVRSLRCVLGELPLSEAPQAVRDRAPSRTPLDAADRRTIEAATSPIHDEDLAAAARRLLTKAWRFSRERGAAS